MVSSRVGFISDTIIILSQSTTRMSSISFPHTQSNSHEDQFYQPSFDTSSFQMNPLSVHPPRTLKTSLHASSSQHFASVYEDASEGAEEKITIDVEDVDIEDESESVNAKEAEKNVPRQEEIWRDIVLSSNGRDKAFVSLASIPLRKRQ